jgi:hypothetical protein
MSIFELIFTDIPEDDEGVDEVTTKISFDTLTEELLPSLPKLKSLAINEIHFNEDNYEWNRHLFVCQLSNVRNKVLFL